MTIMMSAMVRGRGNPYARQTARYPALAPAELCFNTTLYAVDPQEFSGRPDCPCPRSANRCVAVHGGITPDVITWGSHPGMLLLPGCLVCSDGELLDWGL